MKLTDIDLRKTESYKIGYLRGAIKITIQLLENGATQEAITRLKDTIRTIKGVSDGDSL